MKTTQSSYLELITSLCFEAHEHIFVRTSLIQSSAKLLHCALLLNLFADSGDSTATSDYKHPGWCCPYPSLFCTVVWRRLGMGRGVVRLWWVTVTVTPASCLFISCAPPRCLLYSAPWLPDDNSSALTRQPGWVFTGNYVTGTGKTMSPKPLRPAAAQLDSYQYDPVPLLTNAVCKSTRVNSLWCYCSVSLDCCAIVLWWEERAYWYIVVLLLNWCRIQLYYFTKNFDKEPFLRGCNWTHNQTQGVSAFSVQGHRCIRGYRTTHPADRQPGRCDLKVGSCFPAPHYH